MDHLTVTEAAQALHLSVPTIKRYIYEGKLQSVKLPGGQHRIPDTEIQRLLGNDSAQAAEESGSTPEDRVTILERWVTDLQAEVERLTAALEVVSRYCARTYDPGTLQPDLAADAAAPGPVLLVLGPGCRHCDTLAQLATDAIHALGRSDASVRRVERLDDIAAFGPVLTPALAIGDQIILSGRVPRPAALMDLLRDHLPPPSAH